MKAIIDANVVIDILHRGAPTYVAIRAAGITAGCITTGIFMEVLGGAQLPHKAKTRKLLHQFIYLEHNQAIHKLAESWTMKFHFTRSSTTVDFLAGAAAVHHKMPLFTANIKDFERLPGVQIIAYK